MGRHKLQCTEAAIHHTGVYIPWLVGAIVHNGSKTIGGPTDSKSKRKKETEREKERKDHRAEKVETFGSHLPSRIQCID